MKLYYKIDPAKFRDCMVEVRDRFNLHEEIDEAMTILSREDNPAIEIITGSYDPVEDEHASVKAVIHDPSIREFLDEVFGEPIRVR